MRKLAVGLLGLLRKTALLWHRLRGRTPDDLAAERIVSGRSWEEFCDTLKAAGAALTFPGAPRDAFNQAEGYRYLTRLTRAGLEAFVEHADAAAPVIHRVAHETVKLGSDNPDNYYQTARLNGAWEYRITGRRNTIHYLSFGTQIGHYGQGGSMPPTGFIDASDLEIEPDGTFTVLLSSRRQPGNWLPMTEETGTLIVRQTYLDRAAEEPAELAIERLDGAGTPGQVTPALIDAGLKDASTLVAGASLLFAKWARDFQSHTNRLPMFDQEVSNRAGGDPNITYYHSHWALAPDEALVIEALPPACEHWNFQLNNYWMESLDYRYHTIHTNKHLASYRPDGSVRIVVAHQDPGVPNWISTVGHASGTMSFRWIRAEAAPEPATRVVKIADVPSLA
ncbi:MAG: DUF1214 domain-containing protein [Pseudomonadales bacterium]|nr:DUF1214 domain-containing protein [Pseudomonadales bacterium]NIX06797.1 DUF1214 domain-containing protein [Pseudomonadales bacterium]